MRALARRDGCHASTVMRQVRRYESRRDDPLMDEALSALAVKTVHLNSLAKKGKSAMSAPIRSLSTKIDDAAIEREGQRILRRMAEPGSVLVIPSGVPHLARGLTECRVIDAFWPARDDYK